MSRSLLPIEDNPDPRPARGARLELTAPPPHHRRRTRPPAGRTTITAGLLFEATEWSWRQVVAECEIGGAALLTELRQDGPFHVGVLLENTPEYLFLLAGAALAGAVIVGINPTRRGAELAADITRTDCQLVITDSTPAAPARRSRPGHRTPTASLVVDSERLPHAARRRAPSRTATGRRRRRRTTSTCSSSPRGRPVGPRPSG